MQQSKSQSNIFFLVAIIATIPALISKYFPTVDGPSHLEISNSLYYLLFHPHLNFFSEYLKFNLNPVNTNLFFYVLPTALSGKLSFFLIEKIILLIYFISFVLTAKYLEKISQTKINISGFLLLPLIYNFALRYGFYSFLFGVITSFLAIAYCLKSEDQFKLKNYLFLIFIFNLIYLLHPLPFAMTLGVLFSYSVCSWFFQIYIQLKLTVFSFKNAFKFLGKKLSFILCASPGIICLLLTFIGVESSQSERLSLTELIKGLIGFHFLWSYDSLENFIGKILFLFIFVVFIITLLLKLKRLEFNHRDGLLFSIICCIVLYFLSPESLAGGGSINLRISIYVYFLMAVWLGYQNEQKIILSTIKFFSITVFIVLVIFNSVKSLEISDLIEEYVSVSSYVKEQSTIVSFNFVDRGLNFKEKIISNRQPLGHINSYIAASRNSISLNNYQLTRDNFPIKFRSEIYPRTWIRSEPPQIINYNLKTPGTIHYVLLWGASEQKNNQNYQQIMTQLNQNYHLVYTSKPRSLAQLYEINF